MNTLGRDWKKKSELAEYFDQKFLSFQINTTSRHIPANIYYTLGYQILNNKHRRLVIELEEIGLHFFRYEQRKR
jgi:hypothetical protein